MATKAKKGTEQTFYDTFGEWSAIDQAQALKTLQVIHDQTGRMERKLLKGAKADETVKTKADEPVKTEPIYPCPVCGARTIEHHDGHCPNRPLSFAIGHPE